MSTETVVCDIHHMLKSQQGVGGRPQLVSATRTPSLAEYTLIVAQTQSRLAISTME